MTVFAFNHQQTLAEGLAETLGERFSAVELHRFPDTECCIRLEPEAVQATSIVVASLAQPDSITLPLIFLAETLRDYDTRKIILVAPYLAYMRQDKRFNPGDSITAQYYATLLSSYFDGLLTVDPHLHRIHDLNEVYSIDTQVIQAASDVSEWIRKNVDVPLLVGPDNESEQWVSALAKTVDAPYVVLEKIRHGDRDVEVSVPRVKDWEDHTPVLFDDIISTGRTMIETIKHLKNSGMKDPICIGVHAIFTDDAQQQLYEAGAEKVVSCNTISHPSNAIDLTHTIAKPLREML